MNDQNQPLDADEAIRQFLESALSPQASAKLDQMIGALKARHPLDASAEPQWHGQTDTPDEATFSPVFDFLKEQLNPEQYETLQQLIGEIDHGSDVQDRAQVFKQMNDAARERSNTMNAYSRTQGRDGFDQGEADEDKYLRQRLRAAGHPLGDQGDVGTARRYAAACGLGHLAEDAARRFGRRQAMAGDSYSYPSHLRLERMMPAVAARVAAIGTRVFAVPTREIADERFLGHRSRAGAAPMAFDAGPAGRSGAPSISAVFGDAFTRRLNEIGTLR